MANKKLKVGATSEVILPTKKDKYEKKPEWQAKIGGKKGKPEPLVETPEVVEPAVVADEPLVSTEATVTPDVATTPEAASVEPVTANEAATMNDVETELLATADEPVPTKKPRKLKVKTDAPPKKLSMVAAALQVLQERKVAMTCPELIDVMATEGMWVSPGGKTPSNTLYAAISRDIKEKGKSSAFCKPERGKFAAKILTKE
jgi:hypothetical protein